jgi:hypothetical protein
MLTGITLLHAQSRANSNHHERNRRPVCGGVRRPPRQNHRDLKLSRHCELN